MYSVENNAIKLTRGDTFKVPLALTRGRDPYIPQEGDIIVFAVKSWLNRQKTEYVEKDPLITKSIDIQTMILRLDPADTAELPFGLYHYDIQVTFADGEVATVINNEKFEIVPEVA